MKLTPIGCGTNLQNDIFKIESTLGGKGARRSESSQRNCKQEEIRAGNLLKVCSSPQDNRMFCLSPSHICNLQGPGHMPLTHGMLIYEKPKGRFLS